MRKNKASRFFSKYINGTKGAISLFLAILMVPFATIAGVLINAGRINSAVAIFDEALCNASNSTLGTYDSFIRERFSLMAMSQDTSTRGTQFGNTNPGYSADDFLNDLFQFYMEQNTESLGNTYDSLTLEADGLYPLADPAVLKSAILQSSKITVPIKMAVDWGSLDDLLKQLSEPLDLVASIEDTLSSGMNVVSDIDKLIEKKDGLEEQIQKCNDARTAYETAYSEFTAAVDAFNEVVGSIYYWQEQVDVYQAQLDEMDRIVSGINAQIETKRQEIENYQTLEEENEEDYSDEIEALEEEVKELEDEREEKASGYSQTERNRNDAQSNLTAWKGRLVGKQETVGLKKSNYYQAIITLRDEISSTSSAVVAFQDSVKSLINDSVGLISDAATTGLTIASESIDKQKEHLDEEDEYYKYQETLAEYGGYTEEAGHYHDLIQENESTRQNLTETDLQYQNVDQLVSESISTMKDVNRDLTDFSNRDLVSEYSTIYYELDAIRLRIAAMTVPQNYTKMSYEDCFYRVINPVEKGGISLIIEGIENQVVENGGWAVLKAIIGFLDALIKIKLHFDPELDVTIDTSHYRENGGLPSKIDRDVYPLTSPHAAEDAQKAEENKQMLNSFSDEKVYLLEDDAETPAETIERCINDLKGYIDDFKLENLSAMTETAKELASAMASFAGEIGQSIKQSIADKFLLVGYVSYNTANRTTYTGKALSGSSFGLPLAESSDGYCFAGAETEYIFKGSMSETTNQTSVFNWIWIERMLFDIAAILCDATVQTIAATISTFTFGIGGPLVYLVCIVAEAFVDTVILVNGGQIPMIKTFAYITPTGIPRLLKQIVSLKLPEATQKLIYEKSSECAINMNKGIQDKALEHGKYIGDDQVELPRYDDYKSDQAEMDKQPINNIFTIDYTKSLQVLMLFLTSSNKIVNRMADIIQMESSFKAHEEAATYIFNLDKSYTYLRAAGSFASNVFIQIGDSETLNSEYRVIYNGY